MTYKKYRHLCSGTRLFTASPGFTWYVTISRKQLSGPCCDGATAVAARSMCQLPDGDRKVEGRTGDVWALASPPRGLPRCCFLHGPPRLPPAQAEHLPLRAQNTQPGLPDYRACPAEEGEGSTVPGTLERNWLGPVVHTLHSTHTTLHPTGHCSPAKVTPSCSSSARPSTD